MTQSRWEPLYAIRVQCAFELLIELTDALSRSDVEVAVEDEVTDVLGPAARSQVLACVLRELRQL